MRDVVIGWLVAVLAGILFLFFLANRRRCRTEEERLQRAQSAILAEERENEAREEIRRIARERARIAYPELLDATEADKHPIEPFGEYRDHEKEDIHRARDLLEVEIRSSSPAEQWALKAEQETIDSGLAYMNSDPRESYQVSASEYLNGPARIIDCGDAGQIELFTAAQVEAARKQSGRAAHVAYLQRSYDAPDVARRVIDRAKAREEMIERQKQEAKDAITTKVDDLPPLPKNDPGP